MNNKFISNWHVPSNVKAMITTKNGGVSNGVYTSFNLATHVGDNEKTVIKNRKILAQDLPNEPLWLNQIHSTNILNLIDNPNSLNATLNNAYDGTLTNSIAQVAVVMTADCIPLLLTDKVGSFVGAIHAGWRGLADGIVVNALMQLNVNRKDILAYIGPTICQKHFEVGHDVYEKLNNIADCRSLFTTNSNDKLQCNLAAIMKLHLINNNLQPNNITNSNLCTFCEKDLFYSYRRDGITGRIASLIWLDYL